MKILCNISLAFLNTEKDNSLVKINNDVLNFIVDLLQNSLQCEDHASHGFSVDEIIVALNKLAISEENKKKLNDFKRTQSYLMISIKDHTRNKKKTT